MKKYAIFLGISTFLFFHSTQSMHKQPKHSKQTFKPKVIRQIPSQEIHVNCYLEAVPVHVRSYNTYKQLVRSKELLVHEKQFSVDFGSRPALNTIELTLPTSPNYVSFSIKHKNNNNNNNATTQLDDNSVHYGDTIEIKDNLKSIILFNKSTGVNLAEIPKLKSTFRLGTKKFEEQPQKNFTLCNLNIPCLTMTKTAYRHPLKTMDNIPIKESKLLTSHTKTLLLDQIAHISMFSTEDDKETVDSTLTLDIYKALQKVRIRSSFDGIQHNDKIFIKYHDGCVVIFKIVPTLSGDHEQVLASICTGTIHMHLS